MFDDPVQQPQGDYVKMEVLVNKLVIIRPLEFKRDQKTEYKPQGGEAVFANVAVLQPIDGEDWKIFRRVMFMQGYLVGDFKGSLNINLLGQIYEAVADRKPGQKPPYKFRTLKTNEKALAIAAPWMREHEQEFLTDPVQVFGEVSFGEEKKSTLDSMRAEANIWAEEPPF